MNEWTFPSIPVRADALVVFAHPDDEIATFGAILPHGVACGRAMAAVCMTRLENSPLAEHREFELRKSLWTCGMRHEPVLAGFPDCGYLGPDRFSPLTEIWDLWGGRARVVEFITALYRRFRPLVVFTHNPETGEYGHPNHLAAGQACLEAYDALYASADMATPLKLYVPSREEDAWRPDWNRPLAALGGRSSAEVASDALLCHQSQSCSDAGVRPHLAYRLLRSRVGADCLREDFFENCPS